MSPSRSWRGCFGPSVNVVKLAQASHVFLEPHGGKRRIPMLSGIMGVTVQCGPGLGAVAKPIHGGHCELNPWWFTKSSSGLCKNPVICGAEAHRALTRGAEILEDKDGE